MLLVADFAFFVQGWFKTVLLSIIMAPAIPKVEVASRRAGYFRRILWVFHRLFPIA